MAHVDRTAHPASFPASGGRAQTARTGFVGRGELYGHEFVFGELLIGDRGGRRHLLDDYALMRQAPVVPHRGVVAFIRALDLDGGGTGWVDAHLLASALVCRSPLWTADVRLAAVANELGIGRS